ncbi:recombinase family protein [Anaerotignum lactatifermentans]|uniref:Recombinase family protein n=1 Tax=Anaerotignum lactatifermentans TaxID=160404 RepID=A0ABS2GBJ8_9FIRM|nr:recombinase family protein [Anaerotignum lactatifermentans]MBM6828506.1 recombinase family protein [Anaerotignum lactatifermentans]MBM6877913.1 recombinase family protein [Anaerotignum lactatifermentans]MBM6950088.1 recombinase family protein [Anaerotignum lactatifermentans]
MIAIYARQSIEKKDSISIENQIEYAKREIMTDDFKVYQDSGFSGKNTNRPAFAEMMRDIEDGRIEKVVVYKLDRISRSIVDFADFIDELEEKQISFVSATEKFDTSTPMGRAMLYIVVVFAQLERETIAERVRDNYYARVKKGAWGGGPPAYGFDLVRITLDGKKATSYQPNADLDTVARIFELYSRPFTSLADVQRELIKDHITAVSGVNFNNAKLSCILKNPAYVKADVGIYNYYKARGAILANEPEEFDGIHGCILVGKRDANERKYKDVTNHLLAIGQHEGIVDSTVFLYCQEKLSKNRQIKNSTKGKYSWLTGLVKCGHCGYAFSVRCSYTKDGKTPYFVCSGRYLYRTCDVKKTHKVIDVEEQVQARLIKEAEVYHLTRQKKENTLMKQHQQKIAEIDSKIENLISTLENVSQISAEYINQRIESLHREKQLLIHQYSEALTEYNTVEVIPFSAKDWENMSLDDKREVAKSMIDRVILKEDSIDVIFK